MVDSCLYHGTDPGFPLNMNIVNMLNTEFVLAQGRLPDDKFTLVNVDDAKKTLTSAIPCTSQAFFVKEVRYAQSQNEVFATLNSASFDAGKTAVLEVSPRFKSPPPTALRPRSRNSNPATSL